MKLLESKYSSALELIEETGEIPMEIIGDGDLAQLKAELKAIGYTCTLSPSTDSLLCERTYVAQIRADDGNVIQIGIAETAYNDESWYEIFLSNGDESGAGLQETYEDALEAISILWQYEGWELEFYEN